MLQPCPAITLRSLQAVDSFCSDYNYAVAMPFEPAIGRPRAPMVKLLGTVAVTARLPGLSAPDIILINAQEGLRGSDNED